ncbi:hypothetical protein [Corynebacterium auriscanis]|uniref:hypothetical protein n=1 Tax=Corynebacterium auriscanis TaxID=99807 RepID=UPI003CEC004D
MTAQIGRQADALEGRVERRLDDARVGEGLKDLGWDRLAPGQVDDLSGCPVDAVTEQEDAEGLVFGVPVHASGGEVGGAEGFEVQGKRAHWASYL